MTEPRTICGPRTAFLAATLIAVTAWTRQADASATSTAVLQTTVPDSSDTGLSETITRALRRELGEVEGVEASTSTSVPLSELQFALGCLSESAECLRQIAVQLEVDALLHSTVDEVGDGRVLEVAFFRVSTGETDLASRRVGASGSSGTLLDEVPSVVREVLGLPPPAPAAAQTRPTEGDTPPGVEAGEQGDIDASGELQSDGQRGVDGTADSAASGGSRTAGDRFLRALPYLVAGSGLAVLGTGVAFGVISKRGEDDFREASVTTPEEIDAAHSTLESARKQAKLANVLMGAGAVLLGTGTVLFFTLGRDEDKPRAGLSLSPTGSLRSAGMRMTVRYGGAL